MARKLTGRDLIRLEEAYRIAVKEADSSKARSSGIEHRKAMVKVQKSYDALTKARRQFISGKE